MSPGIWQIVIIALLVLLLFGRGKISGFMGDLGKGITSFRKGLKEGSDDVAEAKDPKPVEDKRTIEGETVSSETREKDKA
ncbi:MAG: twin-arginine translocase TatA/TatE family subunit [Alphaproteobacteria bacterium]|nr:MAG: twin-arginine translocase TatA/TatE family subunit [Alphaproteobacteria bacterium]